ncbi:MAG TPA: class I adenylate-forming enzyme family protein [Acidimicrobiia bacterium]|nr:class I adenylate-forming enzyme family protein [Acidimicrobiia bacterium]
MSTFATTRPFADDPRLAAFLGTTERITGPGMPFEIVEEDVLGERLPVFAHRAHSMREILLGATRFGDRDCYVFGDGFRLPFDQLIPQVASLAVALRDRHGIGPGDRVAVCAANNREWLMTFWAVAALDAVLVAMNGWWTGAEMRTALELTDPKLLVMDGKRRERLDGDPGVSVLLTERDFAGLFDDTAATLADVPIAEDDPFILIFTSGTTGRPKAAVLSHRSVISYLMEQHFIAARGMAMAGYSPPPPDSPDAPPPTVRLAPYPLFHVSGMSMAVSTVMSGSPTVWPLGRFDPANVLRLTREENISVWGGGVTHVVRLLQHPDIETIDAKQVTSVGIGGSATPPDVIRQIEERFPHLENAISTGYGSTETGLISWAPGWMLKARPDCVGPLMPTSQARITDDDGNELPPGAEGNIEARSWMSMLGYWHNDAANAETVRPGRWIRTGDFGRFENGILFIASRKRDLIIRGGENIYPFEIEHRLDEHEEVLEAAVYGVDDPIHGQAVKAVVVVAPDSPLTEEEVRAFCALTLAAYKVPEQVELRTEPLPRTANGKVMKQVLAGQAENTFIEE